MAPLLSGKLHAKGAAYRKPASCVAGQVRSVRGPLAISCALRSGAGTLSRARAFARRGSRTSSAKVVAFLEGCKIDPSVFTPYSKLSIGKHQVPCRLVTSQPPFRLEITS